MEARQTAFKFGVRADCLFKKQPTKQNKTKKQQQVVSAKLTRMSSCCLSGENSVTLLNCHKEAKKVSVSEELQFIFTVIYFPDTQTVE